MVKKLSLLVFIVLLAGCSYNKNNGYITTGTIEAYQVDVRASSPGKILYTNIPEGTRVKPGQLLAVMDTTDLHLQKAQLISKTEGLAIQLGSLENKSKQLNIRLEFLNKQVNRLEQLVASGGASQDKLDEILMERDVVRSQLEDIPTQRRSIQNQQNQVQKQIDLLNYRIDQASVNAPADGTILQRYVEQGERIQAGHLLGTIGMTDTVWTMMYIPEPILSEITLGQDIVVNLDGREEPLQGRVVWIAAEAEFTPKTVYTEDTRTSLTYAVRVELPNPGGLLKIGMPVKLRF